MRRVVVVVVCVVLIVLVLPMLSGGPQEPEAQVRRAVSRAVEATEQRDLDALLALVSERFRAEGMDRDALAGVLRVELHRTHWRRVLLDELRVELAAEGERAQVRADALLAGGDAVDRVQDLLPAAGGGGVQAAAYHFDVTLEREPDGEWRVVTARWRPRQLAAAHPHRAAGRRLGRVRSGVAISLTDCHPVANSRGM